MPFERILVAIDGSEPSDHAFTKAVELALATNGTLHALAVEGPLPAYAATISVAMLVILFVSSVLVLRLRRPF